MLPPLPSREAPTDLQIATENPNFAEGRTVRLLLTLVKSAITHITSSQSGTRTRNYCSNNHGLNSKLH